MTLGLFDVALLGSLVIAPPPVSDADAQAYLTAVEVADGQFLEVAVRDAINAFVVGCKADGTWSAIKASCIMAGARTLAGALVPLVGPAPTRLGTEGGWSYNRKTGTAGNGTDNYLNSNRANNADPQNNNHNAVYASTVGTAIAIHGGNAGSLGSNQIGLAGRKNRNSIALTGINMATGFAGINRSASTEFTYRTGGSSTATAQTSETPDSANVTVFASLVAGGGASGFGTHRLAFYSIGQSLNLTLLDTRLTTLMAAIAAAIP